MLRNFTGVMFPPSKTSCHLTQCAAENVNSPELNRQLQKIPHLIEIAAKDFHPEFYRFQLHILLHAAFTLVCDNVIGCIQIYMKTAGH